MITLSSDFGWPYPAAMRGVIASRSAARLIDITHRFPRGDSRTAGFWLRQILPWFPPAVHLVVIDPGVGTDRDVLAMQAGEHVLVGPDNGVLRPAARAIDGSVDAFRLESVDAASTTFHGRDVFAPLAARIHDSGIDDVADLRTTQDVIDLTFPAAELAEDRATGEILVVDGFGNAISNVPGHWLSARMGERIAVNGEVVPVERTYGAVRSGQRLVTVGSHGNVELAVRDGRGSDAFDVAPGTRILLSD